MPFNSPSPAAFIRKGCGITPGVPCAGGDYQKAKMEPLAREHQTHEYIELLLTPRSKSGATGQVHKATIRIALSDGSLLSSPAVVKIAFHDFQRERLRHEHSVYKHMAKKRVKSVASIFGLFQDVDNKSSALIMSDAGISLHEREKNRNPGTTIEQVSVTREERSVILIRVILVLIHFASRDVFKQALSDIHRAGVRHYDIRPMNLLINDEGKATIIDFDMAKMGAGRHSRKREFDELRLLLQGSYCPPNEYRSVTTTQSSRADSDFLKDM